MGRRMTWLVASLACCLACTSAQESTIYMAILSSRVHQWNSADNPVIGLFRSTDRGATWTRSDFGLPHAGAVTSIVADPGNSRMLFAGTGRGVFRSVDGGEHWQPTQAK